MLLVPRAVFSLVSTLQLRCSACTFAMSSAPLPAVASNERRIERLFNDVGPPLHADAWAATKHTGDSTPIEAAAPPSSAMSPSAPSAAPSAARVSNLTQSPTIALASHPRHSKRVSNSAPQARAFLYFLQYYTRVDVVAPLVAQAIPLRPKSAGSPKAQEVRHPQPAVTATPRLSSDASPLTLPDLIAQSLPTFLDSLSRSQHGYPADSVAGKMAALHELLIDENFRPSLLQEWCGEDMMKSSKLASAVPRQVKKTEVAAEKVVAAWMNEALSSGAPVIEAKEQPKGKFRVQMSDVYHAWEAEVGRARISDKLWSQLRGVVGNGRTVDTKANRDLKVSQQAAAEVGLLLCNEVLYPSLRTALTRIATQQRKQLKRFLLRAAARTSALSQAKKASDGPLPDDGSTKAGSLSMALLMASLCLTVLCIGDWYQKFSLPGSIGSAGTIGGLHWCWALLFFLPLPLALPSGPLTPAGCTVEP